MSSPFKSSRFVAQHYSTFSSFEAIIQWSGGVSCCRAQGVVTFTGTVELLQQSMDWAINITRVCDSEWDGLGRRFHTVIERGKKSICSVLVMLKSLCPDVISIFVFVKGASGILMNVFQAFKVKFDGDVCLLSLYINIFLSQPCCLSLLLALSLSLGIFFLLSLYFSLGHSFTLSLSHLFTH